MTETAERLREQYAALPFRRRADGSLEILLVTSRRTGRWIIPKGWPADGVTPFDLAAREAMEEGGVTGRIIDEQPIGCYRHKKTLSDGTVVRCKVDVYALEVQLQMLNWPEIGQRRTQWFLPSEAAAVVRDRDLKALILSLKV